MTRPVEEFFSKVFGRAPRWVARAPGRVNLIGEHMDYNGGLVLPMAIARYTEVAAGPNDSRHIVLYSTAFEETVRIDLTRPIEPATAAHWSNYPRGVVAAYLAAGFRVPGFDAVVHSSVPIGGGLSSSAALEVAIAMLLEAAMDEELEPMRRALLCHEAERTYAGVPCGIMDQFVCTLAREDQVLLLDCRSQEMQWIDAADPQVTLLIVKTHVKHELARSEYRLRREQCETAARALGVSLLRDVTREQLERERGSLEPVVFRRARHVIREIERTAEAAQRIRERDWMAVCQLMSFSHESLCRDFEVSCPELDAIVESARRIGADGGMLGCRMTGGGFGGCAIALIEAAAESEIRRRISSDYEARFGVTPTAFVSRPVAGASCATLLA